MAPVLFASRPLPGAALPPDTEVSAPPPNWLSRSVPDRILWGHVGMPPPAAQNAPPLVSRLSEFQAPGNVLTDGDALKKILTLPLGVDAVSILVTNLQGSLRLEDMEMSRIRGRNSPSSLMQPPHRPPLLIYRPLTPLSPCPGMKKGR